MVLPPPLELAPFYEQVKRIITDKATYRYQPRLDSCLRFMIERMYVGP